MPQKIKMQIKSSNKTVGGGGGGGSGGTPSNVAKNLSKKKVPIILSLCLIVRTDIDYDTLLLNTYPT